MNPDEVEEYPGNPAQKAAVEEEALSQLCAAIGVTTAEATPALRRISRDVIEEIRTNPNEGPSFPGKPRTAFQIGQLGWTHWAIRKEQLDLFKQVGAAAAAVAAYVSVATASPAVLAVALAIAGLELARRLRNKGVVLTENQVRLLLLLRERGPSRAEDLVPHLNGLRMTGALYLDVKAVEELLISLADIHANDGTVEHLTVKTPAGVWSANGV